ncbi:MAG: transporter, partial [Candidatus Cloacimonetes bacterium]|nr:transporter [Candidatus Cloacimonadota bacterium]
MEFLNQGYMVIFLIISTGIVFGRISVKGFSLDNSAIIFVALVMGHFGFKVSDEYQRIGLFIFIFTIGIQAGPGFFESFKNYGKQLIITAIIIVSTGAVTTVILSRIIGIDSRLAAGIFTGALTSAPGLAAATEASASSLASIGYGVAYPFGVIGVILFMKIVPKFTKMNIP